MNAGRRWLGHLAARRSGALVAALAVFACSDRAPSPVGVEILLAWDRAGVVAEDGSTRFRNDLGYDIALDVFEITTYSIELIPCDQDLFRRLQNGDFGTRADVSLVSKAWAGHGSMQRPTRTTHVQVESPNSGSPPLLAERLTVPDARYCQVHIAIARAPQTPAQVAGAEPSTGMSLRLAGRYRRGAGTWTEVSLETPVAHGVLLDLAADAPTHGIDFEDGDGVIIIRLLATVLDGVDFAAMSSGEIGRQVLRQIVKDTVARRREQP